MAFQMKNKVWKHPPHNSYDSSEIKVYKLSADELKKYDNVKPSEKVPYAMDGQLNYYFNLTKRYDHRRAKLCRIQS